MAGYTFSVLNNHFLVHDGWKEAHASARLMETYRNWVLFNFHFQQTLLKQYNTPGDVYNQKSCSPIETWHPKGSFKTFLNFLFKIFIKENMQCQTLSIRKINSKKSTP